MKQRIQKQFKRKESKYIIAQNLLTEFLTELEQYMAADDYARSTITSIYFDNADNQMIQDALAKKHGREKVRMRLYGEMTPTSAAFLEIKKKQDKVGHKYRLVSTPVSIQRYIEHGIVDGSIQDQQVTEELAFLHQRYGKLGPRMVISYDRLSFKGKVERDVRVTVDSHLLYKSLSCMEEVNRQRFALLPTDQAIMEIKVPDQQPAWLVELVARYGLEKVSFSKYGKAYLLSKEVEGGQAHAVV